MVSMHPSSFSGASKKWRFASMTQPKPYIRIMNKEISPSASALERKEKEDGRVCW